MKKLLIPVLAVALIGAGCGAYYYMNQSSLTERISSDSDDAVYVMTVSAITGYGSGSGVIETWSGQVEAQETLSITLDDGRTLDECFVEEGDTVTEGQKLFSYDTTDDEQSLAQAKLDIEQYELEIEQYEKQMAADEKLQKTYTDEDDKTNVYLDILVCQNQIKVLEYDIQEKELEMDALQETIDASIVTAELSGTVQSITPPDSSEDSLNSSGESAYMTIVSNERFQVRGTLNELNLLDIEEGMTVILRSRIDSDIKWTGTITEIDLEPEEDDSASQSSYYESSETVSYPFYVEPDDDEGMILGQHVTIEIDNGQDESKDGLWLSEYYILQEDGCAYVWFAGPSNVIEKHEITLGDYDEGLCEYEILDGLEADDYIAYPQDNISEGDAVEYYDIS
ncbi:MAG: efflux RND transporter periplasmic adaptor subunit [Lachnospiraceae bacterium]|nr:efflux RND transporter periplasmic adaptor subunit [Lachnospiraceae bacterium]MCD7840933.1 efflux RND transporter periplasmic adaptor subunit [Lachnospiraceae bacterium]